MSVNALDMIDAELARAAAPRSSNKKPLFLFLKEGHKALFRPLYNLQDALVLSKHNKYAEEPAYRVNSICAAEDGKRCAICARVADDKKLSANIAFYLPIYVHGVVDQSGVQITYKERDDAGNESQKVITGVRLLELTSFGTIGQILKFFREYTRDEGSITGSDFTISQIGAGQQKSFVCMPKAAKPMSDAMRKLVPPADRIRERILEALPPVVAASTGNDTVIAEKVEDDDIDF